MDTIVVEHLIKEYAGGGQRKRALDGVSLRVPAGSAFGLVGPNGAGKTTLLKTLLGVVRATAGQVQVFGGSPELPEVRQRIGYLPERLGLPAAWTARAFLHSVARMKGVSDAARDVDRQLERVGLAHAASLRVGTFSKGMRQRLGLSAALLGKPDLLILDEPTDGIDPRGRVEVRQLLLSERARGATIFLNSHLLSETERICDRVGFLVAGKLRHNASLDELSRDAVRWRVRFAEGHDAQALIALGMSALPNAGWYLIEGDAETLNAMIGKAQACAALVIAVEPEARDLESRFMDLVEDSA